MEREDSSTPIAEAWDSAPGPSWDSILARRLWHVMYGVNLLFAIAVVAEIGVMLILAFAYAWRSAR